MSKSNNKAIVNRLRRINNRLSPRNWKNQAKPMFSGSNIHYEVSQKSRGMIYGGLGVVHRMVTSIGLAQAINSRVQVLSKHVPYHESDHVLNITYNVLTGGTRLEDIETRRQDEAYLDALGAQRIPDPTTGGDFTRRFGEAEVLALMESINDTRRQVWQECGNEQPLQQRSTIDVDGTVTGTLGNCKQGMDMSYKGIWGYHPLIISLAETREVLYLVNRPGNVASHQDAAPWIDKAIELAHARSERILLRGDTAFSLTANFDRWDSEEEGGKVEFVFGMDARKNLIELAQGLPGEAWTPLDRSRPGEGASRQRPDDVKEGIVKERGYKKLRLQCEDIAEFSYRPGKCGRDYRVVALRKNISVERGEKVLFPDIRYFFYIANCQDESAADIVRLANGRCDQENVIEQLKNGVNAMRMPVDNLMSNWAYMVMAALAWNLKSWLGLLHGGERGREILCMEFATFTREMILLACQIVKSGRRIIYRLLMANSWSRDLLELLQKVKRIRLTPQWAAT